MATKRKAAKAGLKVARAMPGKRSAARRGAKLGARAAKRSAYLQAVLHNDRAHERLRTGVGSARAAYRRVSRRGKGADHLAKDRKARRELARAIASFQAAAAAVRGEKVRRRRRIGARAVVPVVAVGSAGALALSPGLRERLLRLVSSSSNGAEPAAQSAGEGDSTASEAGPRVEPEAPGENVPPTIREE